jgi:hypothetical protein
VFHFDAQNMDADGDINSWEPSNASLVSDWFESVNSYTWSQSVTWNRPVYNTWAIDTSLPWIVFDGTDDLLEIDDTSSINLLASYSQKSIALVIETGSDITSLQTLYEQWVHYKWYGFQIVWWNLYGWVWNTLDWTAPDQYKVINFWAVLANETYYITLVHDNTTLRWYLDGTLINTLSWVNTQTIHGICKFDTFFGCSLYWTGWTIWIGATQNDMINLSTQADISPLYQGNYYSWAIGEILSWNHALTPAEVSTLDDYFTDRWEVDSVPPVISSFTPFSWSLLPWGNHDINIAYSDTWTNASWIDTAADRSIRYDLNIAPDAGITNTPATIWWVPPHPQSIEMVLFLLADPMIGNIILIHQMLL